MIDLSLFQQYGPALLRGLGMTIFCWLVGTVFAMALGFVMALVQRSASISSGRAGEAGSGMA